MKVINDITPLLEPGLATAFSSMPTPTGLVDVLTRRALSRQLMQRFRSALAPSEAVTYSDLGIRSADGYEVPLRVFAPRQPRSNSVLLWIHGGGFSSGHHEDEDVIVRPWIEDIGCTVVSVGYRRAPEFQAPCALDDCYAALEWIAHGSDELRVKPENLAVGGISAGGALAAGVALRARDEQGPALCFQMLLVPCTDNRSATASMKSLNDPRQWNIRANIHAWQIYAGGDGDVSPYVAPARMIDVSRLPPTYMEVAGVDPLRDEGVEYATRMMRAGVPTELHVFPGAYHASSYLQPLAPISLAARDEAKRALKMALLGG